MKGVQWEGTGKYIAAKDLKLLNDVNARLLTIRAIVNQKLAETWELVVTDVKSRYEEFSDPRLDINDKGEIGQEIETVVGAEEKEREH